MPGSNASYRTNKSRFRSNKKFYSNKYRTVNKFNDLKYMVMKIDKKFGRYQLREKTEKKYHDANATGVTAANSANPAIVALSLIATGNTNTSRIGNEITGNNLNIKFRVRSQGSTTAAYGYIRIVIVADRKQEGTAPSLASVFQNVGSTLSPWNREQMGSRYKMLFDKLYSFDTDQSDEATYEFF